MSDTKHTLNKTIIVQWVPEETWGYGKAMRVIQSDHPRFEEGARFDYGFFDIATEEGFTIVSLPLDEKGHLIIAAPALLEALEECLPVLEMDYLQSKSIRHIDESCEAACIKKRDRLAFIESIIALAAARA